MTHVVDVADVSCDEGLAWMVMEHLEGEDLGALLDRVPRLNAREVADLIVPVVAAVLAAHEEGIVHRDLKPGNIFLAKTRHGVITPKVLDFGISKLLHVDGLDAQTLTNTTAMVGTPYYMAPEQVLSSRNASPLSDQYALGVILYRAVTGRLPFREPEIYPTLHAITTGLCAPPSRFAPDLAPPFEALIGRAMARDPAQRFPSVRELGAELLQHASPVIRAQWAGLFGDAPPASLTTVASAWPVTNAPPDPSQHHTTLGGSAASLPSIPPPAPQRANRSGLVLAVGLSIAMIVGSGVMAFRLVGVTRATAPSVASTVHAARASVAAPPTPATPPAPPAEPSDAPTAQVLTPPTLPTNAAPSLPARPARRAVPPWRLRRAVTPARPSTADRLIIR